VVLHGQSPSQLSPGSQQIDDLGPDGRCQAVPVCDQLVECHTRPAHFRPGFSHHVVTTLRADNCGTRASGAIPAASTFSEHAYSHDRSRQDTSKPVSKQGVATHQDEGESRQQATPNVSRRPSRATKSATGPWEDDPDLAAVIDAWDRRPGAVRAGIVAIVKKSSVER